MYESRRPFVLTSILLATASLTGAAAHAATPIEKAAAATAYVTSGGRGLGTAFCIGKDGLFLTNAHVVGQSGSQAPLILILNSGEGETERRVPARIVHSNLTKDLALLQADDKGKKAEFAPLELVKDVGEIKLGEDIRILGFPLGPIPAGGENPSVSLSKGVISSLRKLAGTLVAIQTDAAVNQGNSGGPLFLEDGRVAGIVTWRIGGIVQNIGFALAANQIAEFLKEPRLSLKEARIDWNDRFAPYAFEAEILPSDGGEAPDQLAMIIHSAGQMRSVQADIPKEAGTVSLRIAPYGTSHEPLSLHVRRGTKSGAKGGRRSTTKDAVLIPGDGTRLADVEWINALPNEVYELHLRNGESRQVTRDDLQLTDAEAGQLLPPPYENTTVHVGDATLGALTIELCARRQGKELTRAVFQLVLKNRPLFANHPGDQPDFSKQDQATHPRDRFTVGLWAEGIFETRLLSESATKNVVDMTLLQGTAVLPEAAQSTPVVRGLQLSYTLGPPPGYFSLIGPHVFLSGRLHHPFYDVSNPIPPTIGKGSAITRVDSSVLPLKLAPGKWRCQVFRDYAVGDKGQSLLSGEADAREEDGTLAVRISTPKYQPAIYRLVFEREKSHGN